MRVCVETSTFRARFAGIAYYAWFMLDGLVDSGEAIELSSFDGVNFATIDRAYLDAVLIANDDHSQKAEKRSAFYQSARSIPMVRQTYRKIKDFRFRREAGRFDVFHAMNYISPSPSFRRTLPLFHDLSHERFPQTHPDERVEWLRKGLTSLHRSPLIQTVSDFSAGEIAEFYRIDRASIRTIYPGVNPLYGPEEDAADALLLQRLDLTKNNYFLAVGTLEPRKNLKTVLKAFGGLSKVRRVSHPLVLVGQPGWGDAGLSDVEPLVAEGSVRLTGYQSADRLAILYRHSRTVVFPSIYEGFGFPTVEALACGKRPILSDIPVMREIAGGTADYVEPLRMEGWTAALDAAIDDARHDGGAFVEAGVSRAKAFSWSANARQTTALYREAIGCFDAMESSRQSSRNVS